MDKQHPMQAGLGDYTVSGAQPEPAESSATDKETVWRGSVQVPDQNGHFQAIGADDQQTPGRYPSTTVGSLRPWVTYCIIGLCVLVYLASLLYPGLLNMFGFVPLVAYDQPWRFVTAAFLHSVPAAWHIAFNMYALWVVGPLLERLLGHLRFFYLYMASALGGSVAIVLSGEILFRLHPDETTLAFWLQSTVGASGAVFGLFGALISVFRRLRLPVAQIGVIIVINLVLGFSLPGIAWQAHIGGLLVGGILGSIFGWSLRRRTQGIPKAARNGWLAALGVGIVLIVGLALYMQFGWGMIEISRMVRHLQ